MLPQIPQFQLGTHPFKFNDSYDLTQGNEANTYLNVYAESTFLFGSDVVFLPRTPDNPEPIFGEYLASKLEAGYPMRLFVEDVTNWNGNGDVYSKFGLQVNDTTTFHCPKKMFEIFNNGVAIYPKQGDLIYYVKGKKLFEIQHIEDETQPGFYVFGNRQSYVIKCKAYTYDHMQIAIDESIPPAVSSLASLATQDQQQYNDVVQDVVAQQSILDNTEVDPITGR